MPSTSDYHLVWADEFNTDGPVNPADWEFEHGFVRNNELQWYQEVNAFCKGGCLIIEARREHLPNPRYIKPTTEPSQRPARDWRNRESIDYTSASINTRGKHAWLYGRFEIRAKIDVRAGSWPAFWTLGTTGPWPACGEVDIMEYYDNTVLANIAWDGTPTRTGRTATWNSKRVPLTKLANDWPDQFHTWRMDWDENSMDIYLDDELVNSQDLSKTINAPLHPTTRRSDARDTAPANPFRAPMYILLNQALGGTKGGDPSNTEFPLRYLVDYVRIYQTPAQQAANKRQANAE